MDLTATDHLALAKTLKELALDAIQANPDAGGEAVAVDLRQLMAQVWPGKMLPADRQRPEESAEAYAARMRGEKEAAYRSLLEGKSAEQQTRLLEAYARIGHLYEIAGLWARENYFSRCRAARQPIPGGIEETVNGMKFGAAQAVEAFNAPVFEIELTAHATNTNSLPSMKAQRAIGEALRSGDEEGLKTAVAVYMDPKKTPLLHRDEKEFNATHKTEDRNFTVRDETENMLFALANIYDDLPEVYAEFDAPLAQKYQQEGAAYDGLALQLDFRLGSWGSAGDKDGNKNVFAESTLEAVMMHKLAIQQKYLQSLQEIGALLPDNETVSKWRGTLEGNIGALNALLEGMRGELQGNAFLPPERFDDYMRRTAAINPSKDDFVSDLKQIYSALPENGEEKDTKTQILALIRRARLFGFTFGKIEYRETAEEYARVTGLLVDGYDTMSDTDKKKALEKLLQSPGDLQAAVAKAQPHFLQGAQKPYADKAKGKDYNPAQEKRDALPIAYHTLKRMELARAFPDMITDNVLAECKGAHNLLEARLMQCLSEKDGKRAVLGIVPLFEDPSTMQRVDEIMEAAYKSAPYRDHLQEVMKERGLETLTQQVQIAHSDNARRSGLMAARGFIHQAHRKLRALHEGGAFGGIKLQFFEGGSQSDAFRSGVRSLSATVDDFKLYDFAKFTFQGGDLLNYLNQSCSITRLFSRAIGHAVKRTLQEGKSWEAKGGGNDKPPVTNAVADEVAINALTATLGEYQTQDFDAYGNPMGAMMALLLDYGREARDGSAGSRSGMRGGPQVQAAGIAPVPVDSVRTIPFSEAWQHNGVMPTWIGGDLLTRHLYVAIAEKWLALDAKQTGGGALAEEEKKFYETFDGIVKEGLWPKHVRALYDFKSSPAASRVFHDAMDRAAYGAAFTDPHMFEWMKETLKESSADTNITRHTKNLARGYLDRIIETFQAFVPSPAKTPDGAEAQEANGAPATFEARVRKVPKALQELTFATLESAMPAIQIKQRYRDFLLYFKRHMEHSGTQEYWHQRRTAHNALDTVMHGRMIDIEDRHYRHARSGPEEYAMAL